MSDEITNREATMTDERRKEPRFRVCSNTFAVDWSAPQRLGEVLDISRSGMSFRCIEEDNGVQRTSQVGIFSSTHKFFLQEIDFETVSDQQMLGHPQSFINMRRQSGRFISLTPEQQNGIDAFIDHHALGSA